jgi:hypothetical protein
MVQAILTGRKTQTRRVLKVQPKDSQDWKIFKFVESTSKSDRKNEGKLHWATMENEFSMKEVDNRYFECPYGKVGDVLWVRETFCFDGENYIFKPNGKPYRWKPSIYMPKEAARIWLEIVSVKVERLQEISDEDSIAEGVDNWTYKHAATPQNWMNYMDTMGPPLFHPQHSFISLWDSTYGEQSWEENPWVWVVEFKQIENPNNNVTNKSK